MCGRFSLRVERSDLEEQLGFSVPETYRTRFNCAPQQELWMFNAFPSNAKLIPSLWGWQMQVEGKNRLIINARSETIAEKKLFTSAFQSRRTLVPISGFFEWDRGRSGDPYHFEPPPGQPVAFAAVYRKEPLLPYPSFLILTTEAGSLMGPIHHRQPLVLYRHQWDAWLDPSCPKKKLLSLCAQSDLGEWKHWKVSPEVNHVRNDHPQLLEPWESPQDQLEFGFESP